MNFVKETFVGNNFEKLLPFATFWSDFSKFYNQVKNSLKVHVNLSRVSLAIHSCMKVCAKNRKEILQNRTTL